MIRFAHQTRANRTDSKKRFGSMMRSERITSTVQVFDGLNSRTNLDVDVAVILGCKVWVIRYDPIVAKLNAFDDSCSTIVRPGILRVSVLVGRCNLREGYWETLSKFKIKLIYTN